MHVGHVHFVTVKVTLWFQHIPLCFHGYACDYTWCMHDSNDQIIYNAAVVLQFYMIHREKRHDEMLARGFWEVISYHVI